jgi:hypothetical protein
LLDEPQFDHFGGLETREVVLVEFPKRMLKRLPQAEACATMSYRLQPVLRGILK